MKLSRFRRTRLHRIGWYISAKLIYISYFLSLFALPVLATPPPITEEPIELTKSVGVEIDSLTREEYHLFPDVKSFNSGRFLKIGERRYIFEYSSRTSTGLHTKRINLTSDTFEQTRAHCNLVEKYKAHVNRKDSISDSRLDQYYIALEYASKAQYDISARLAEDFLATSPESLSPDIRDDCNNIIMLSKARRALFRPGFLYDRGGRTDVLVFAGYYGVWAGVAIPVWLDAQSSDAFAAGMIAGPAISLLLAAHLTKEADISRGRASIIILGGHLGTWQGLGWSILADADGEQTVGMGLIGGLAGITSASILTRHVYFSEGQGALTGSALSWGTWFGLVFGAAGGLEGDALLRSTLLGSDLLVVATAIGTKDIEMSRTRARLISLGGVLGTVAGFGVDLLFHVDDGKQAIIIAGAGSIAGLAVGANLTKNYDKGRTLSYRDTDTDNNSIRISPKLSLIPDPSNSRRLLTTFGFSINF